MTPERGVDDGSVGTTVGVTTALDELNSRGATLLVVGSVPESIYARLSASMLGEGADRRRLIVERLQAPGSRLDAVDRWTPEWTRVFRCRMASRRSAVAGTPDTTADDPSPGPTGDSIGGDAVTDTGDEGGYDAVTDTVDGSIADLGVAVGSTIGWFDAVAGGLDPTELRMAFDCVGPLVSAYPRATVFRFLHLLTNQIRSVDGLGHVRLSRPLDAEVTRLLAPLFDVTVELSLDGGEACHRWHFRDADVSSEWLPIEPMRGDDAQ